jgi:DNA-binding CsgD family transcriptional regulator
MDRAEGAPDLSPAQVRILACLAEGLYPNEVPLKLNLHHNTVRTQISRICEKLGAENWREALLIYRSSTGLIPLLNQAEVLLRAALLDPRTNNTLAQPKLLQCLDALERARQILKALR